MRILVLLLAFALSGCAGLDAFFDVTDALLGDPTVHQGEVRAVEYTEDTTTVHFQDGISYEVDGYRSARPGTTKKVTRDADGKYNLE